GCFLNAIGPSFFADDFSGGSVQSVRVLVGTQNVNGTSFRQVEFCIEQLEKDLSVKFENRVLSLDSKSVCKLKVSLAAKIVLYGVKWAQPDVSKENGDPDKNGSDSDSDITDINSAHNKMLEQLVTPTINNLAITNNDHKAVMDKKRKNIIDAIKAVCKDCCCNMTAEQYCIQPTDISEAVKQVCANCCCKNKDPCVDSSKIMEHVNKLCVDCCCKKQDCCNTKEVLSQIGDFCVCVIKEAKEKLENCTCDKCSSCKENCIDKGKLMKEIEQLCSCDKAKKVVENSAQNCDSCKGSGGSGCQCCQEAKKQFESCSCMACDLKRVIDDLQGSGENGSNKCCNNSSCPCSSDSDSNCRTKEAVLSALNAYCKCKDQVKQIKEKINGLCKHCNKNKCCDVTNIQSDIEQLCNSCPCKTQKKCCNENEIKSKVQQNGDLSNKTDEQTKLKKIALTIFKYFRPPIAYTTGLMTLKSKTDIDLDFSSNSSSDDKITVDTSKNSLKIPKKAFQTIMASSQIVQGLVIVYHPNSMMSINFEEIILSFPKLCNEGFKIDGFPIHHDFSMKIQYGPAGPYTRPTANWRNKNSDKSKHELSWSLSYPQIDKNKCSCSILSDPLFGTVFGAICLTISIVQFIIALFVSQGYYDGFQSYMDAVRSGFSWPTQYDNVVSSIFWWLGIGVRNGTQLLLVHINTYDYFKTSIRISISPTLGTYEAVRVQVGTQNVNGTSFRQVEFCIEQLEKDLSVKFENRVLSLDSKSVCKLKVSLAAKIVLYGVKWAQPDVSKENGDPDKNGSDSDSDITDINSAHNKMLEQLVTPTINNLAITNNDHKAVMDKKRKNIIDAIKAVCKDCCCNRAEDYCIKPTDIVEQIKQVCASCCCKSDKPCVDSGKIMDEVNKLCVDCCCKKQDCCNTKEVLSQIGDFCVCVIKEAKEKLENCTCDKCSSCKENCIDKTKLMKEILKLCSCDNARIQLEEAAQNCDSCKGSGGSCQCCQEIQKKFKDCPCMACNLKRVIDEIQGSGENGSNCCDSSSCSCSSDSNSNCRKRTDVLKALNAYCKCKDQVKQIKEKIEKLCKQCNKNTCCDSSLIQNDIQKICNSCPCKQKKCCNESEINKKVQQVIESSCKCRVNKCCFRDITDGDLSSHSKEQAKLKNIAKAIFKYFRPPIAYETGVMTLESTTETELEFSSGGDEKITVDTSKNVLNTLKIPKQAFKDLMASAKMHENKVKDFHPNSMMSIEFHGITLTFCTLSGEGFKLDGYPIKGGFSMKMEYAPAGIFTRSTALWRKKNSDKHDLSWDKLSQPQIDPSKCSCSILSDPLFGTVFGAICLTISIVQFIIALFISQGYYDGFQSYMDAVRSGFSWPTQYDNVVNSVFWQGYPSTPTLGTYEAVSGCFLNAIGPSFFADDFSGGAVQSVRVLVGTRNVPNTQLRNVEFCIQELQKEGLTVKFENRVLSLDSGSDCKLKVSLHAKINLVGVKWAQPDTTKDNGDPDKNDSDIDSGNKAINSAYNTMLEELVSPDANSDSSKKSILDAKRKNIIEAIKDVCKDCCCNRNEYCIQPTDISEAVKQVCANCCCKQPGPCVDSDKIMEHVNKLCQNCCCKQKDCCNTEGVLSQIGEFCVCLIKEAKEKLENCTCSGCSTCQENCIDKQKLMTEILKLCSCSEAKKELENSAQNCDSCKGSGGSGCQCCEAAKKQFESCPCMACNLKKVIDGLQGSGENGSNCCNSSSCSCSSDSNSNCRTKDAVLTALKTYCKCKDQVKQIKEKIEKLCKQCNKNTCCDVKKIEKDIQDICNDCDCKKKKCCNESEINKKVQQVIDEKCTCRKNKCCFRDITDGDLSDNTKKAEKEKLKNIALAIFKYFRPPIAHSTGVMTLKSTADIDLQFSSGSSSSQDNITVDAKNKNVLKIPKQAFKDLIASTKINQVKVTTFHKNTMLSIHFEEISLTFQKLNGTGFEIDGYPINGTFSMQLGYQPIGPFTKNSANMRKKTENEPKKHNLSWGISSNHPRIDPSKCSCSILSDPLFGTVFGAICLTISIVQFIIALFVSQGYYDGFQSYMDAVGISSTPTLGTYAAVSIYLQYAFTFFLSGCFLNAIGPSFFADSFAGGSVQSVRVQVGSSGSQRHVEFSIELLKQDLSVKFENRVLSLDSKSVCKLKVSLAAKINLVGVKWFQPDVSKENGDPDKNGSDSDSDITVINSAYNTMLEELVSPSSSGDASKKKILDGKRKNIIEAIKDVCKDCCCNRNEYCIQPTDISEAVKQVCASCCCKSDKSCVDSSKIMEHVNKLCQNCCCKKDDCCGTKEVLSQIGDFCVCVIKEAKEKLENCTCSGCSSCQENCIDKQKLMKEILKLCSCSEAKKELENSAQNCDSCKGSGGSGCQCCEAAKKQFESCPCMACNLKTAIDEIKQEDGSNCCSDPSCSCSSGSNCRKRTDVLSALNAYCKCKDQVKQIKEKIEKLCKQCNKNTCCDSSLIQNDIQKICNSCPCKQKKCCNESEIKSKVQQVIESSCKCRVNKCCFNGIQNGDLSKKTAEKEKLKNIALAIFKYFRPPIAHSTGLMTLKSTADIDLQFSSGSSSSQDNITVDAKNKNVLKIPKQAFKDLMASTKINQVKVTTFHKNTMLSIHFEEISLTFQKLNGTGFEIDGYPINGTFSMQLGYQPIGPFTKNSANMRKKTENEPKKHNLSWGISSNHPRIDPSKCSCSILSDPLFGTVFGAICLTISIVQFIIALFVSQGYYDGFQSYMDAVGISSTPTLGTYAAVRNVEFCIEQIGDLTVNFENRVLSLDSGSDCKLKVGLHAKIVLYGVKWFEPDTMKWNGGGSDDSVVDDAYSSTLGQLISPSIGGKSINTDSTQINTMDEKRLNIINAIKEVCKSCCCNRTAEQYCIQPTDISEAVKQVCANCCCKNKDPCVDSSKIMEHVNKLCQNCCCKKDDCCGTKEVLSQIGEFCVCLIKDAKEKLENCTCDSCSSCQGNCIDKTKLKKEILKLCSCSEAKKVVEQAPQKCDSCKGSGSCQCCQEIQKQFESCPCMACDLQQVIDEIKQEDGSNCCSDPSCSCSSGSNCRKRTDVLSALNTYCKCKDQVKQIKEKIEKLCKQCNKNTCCDVKKIEKDIQDICNDCDCKKKKCCNESEINKKVQQVIDEKCTCRKNKCCFRDITDGDLSDNTKKAEKEKLKNIALAIFKYFRPPIAHSTGLMTLKSTADIDLQFSSGSSSSQDNITVDAKNKNVLKIPKQAFKDLMASSQIPQVKVTTFHKNTMLSIHFEEISLTFQKLNGTGFEIDGYPINGTFSMQLGYQPIGPYTKNTANWRNKTSDKSKHDLSWSIGGNYPRIDPSKCSCSILSDPLFGTVFGAICLTISIVQFIIALFVSQGYYDGFQSYMDAVRSGFSWPTQYDNVVSSIFCMLMSFGICVGISSTPTLGTYAAVSIYLQYAFTFFLSGCFLNAIGPSFFADSFAGGSVQSVRVQVGSSGSQRHVEFSIELLKQDLSVKFENRVLSLDSKSVCKLKVSLAAKINLVGVKWFQPDVSKENGDPDKNGSDSDSDITVINSAYNTMLEELVSPSSSGDASKKKFWTDVCKDCCCNRNEYCIQPTDISEAVKQVCASCCCKSDKSCVDSSKIMEHVNKLCQNCCCKKDDCCGTKEVLSQIGDFCVCVIKEAKEKLENCTCSGCSSCQENCIDKQKLMKEILKLCSCSEAKKELENSAQNCDSCKGSGGSGCQCCEAAKKQFESCPCMACNLKTAIDEIKQEDGSNCCSDPSCSCSSGSNCRKRTDVLSALNAYCKCKDQVKQIKEKIEKLCKQCNKNTCCDSSLIQNDIQKICNSCPCKQKKCCNESEIKSKVQQVIESSCKCRVNKCCFNGIQNGDLSKKTAEKEKLKNIALAIFKYFRPPIAHSTGLMTLKSTADIDLQFSSGSSSSQDNITVDAKNKNVLKIPNRLLRILWHPLKYLRLKLLRSIKIPCCPSISRRLA
ncbi:uncharacterized protein BdWA1_003727, partial [Babesia duncani]